MNTISFVLKNRKRDYSGPSAWSELKPRQWLQYLAWQVKLGGELAGRFLLLQLWYHIPPQLIRQCDSEKKDALQGLLDWLLVRPSRWMLPRLRIGFSTWLGPGDGLEHLTFGEFIFAEQARQDPGALADLMAALYRPRAWFWQKRGEGQRRPFVRNGFAASSRRMSRLPETIKQGTLINYLGCVDLFPEQFPYLFKPSSSAENKGNTTWLDVGLKLAQNTGALGSYPQMEQLNLYLVLTTLDQLQQQQEELEAKMKAK